MKKKLVGIIYIWFLAFAVTIFAEDAEHMGVQSITLPANLQVLKEEAFRGDVSIGSVTIPSGVQEIESYAFADCAGLELLAINEGAQVTIDPNAFSNCGLSKLAVGTNAAVTIQDNAFSGCQAPFDIIISEGAKISFSENALANCGDITFTVHQGTDIELYAICHGYKTVSLGDEDVLERTRALISEYGVQESLLQSGAETNRLIVKTEDDRLPDISGYEPVAIVRNGSNEYYIQFEDEASAVDCMFDLREQVSLVEMDRLQRCSVDQIDEDDVDFEQIYAAGVTDASWWGTTDPMGFDVYWPYVASNQSGSQTIAVIDCGVVLNKASYDSRILMETSRNFSPDGSDADQWCEAHVPGKRKKIIKNYHGSVIADIIDKCAGDANINLMILRVCDDGTYVLDSLLEQAIMYAVENGADIINLSLNMPDYSQAVADAVGYALNTGVQVVVASGNEKRDVSMVFPANLPGVTAVSGVVRNYVRDSGTGYGSGISYAAPSRYIMDAIRQSPDNMPSTSFAAPQIASAIALVSLDTTHHMNDLDACCLPVEGAGMGMPQLNLLTDIPIREITISPETPGVIQAGEKASISWVVAPAGASSEGVKVVSSDPDVLSVEKAEDGSYRLAAMARGTATVTVRAVTGVSDSIQVQVIQPVKTIKISSSEKHVQVGKTLQLVTLSILPENADNRQIIWKSSDENVATVSESGILTPISEGMVTITAEAADHYGGISDPLSIEVVEEAAPDPNSEAFLTIRTLMDGSLEVTGLKDGAPDEIIIPAEINGVAVTSIAENAFVAKRLAITRVTIPGSVKSIGNYAFSGCENLSSVNFSEGLEYIGKSAFKDCTSLTDLVIPQGVTAVGDTSFSGCSDLRRVVIPGSIAAIPTDAFINCTNLVHVDIGEGVGSIGENAFCGCSGLEVLNIPSSVTMIGRYAFGMCTGLNEVNFSEGLIEIEELAFRNCGLTRVSLPDSLRRIGQGAFRMNGNLISINLPAGLTEIGDGALDLCEKLSVVTVVRGTYAHTWAKQNSLPVHIIEPNGGIPEPADSSIFSYELLRNGDVEITGIVEGAECPSELIIPGEIDGKNVTSVTAGAFANNTVIEDLVIPAGVTAIGEGAFRKCMNLRSALIPQGVTVIPGRVFEDCRKLVQVNLPQGVTTVGNNAFYNCTALTQVDFPDTLGYIGNLAFYHCSLSEVSFSENLSYIGQEAFSGNAMASVSVPEGTQVKTRAFAYCVNITTAQSPAGSRLFEGCGNLAELTILPGSSVIFSGAYADSAELVSVQILPGITRICEGAFYNCPKLEEVELPEGLTKLDERVFENCCALTRINFPQTLDTISDTVFAGCSALARITVIRNSFGHQWALEKGYAVIVVEGEDEVPIDAALLNWTEKGDGTLEVTGFKPDAEYPFRLILPAEIAGKPVTSIGDNAFKDCVNLTTVIIPDGYTQIGQYAFYSCGNLTEAELPESLQSMGWSAFGSCGNLSSLTLPDELASIGSYAIPSTCRIIAKEDSNAAEAVSLLGRYFRDPENRYDLKYTFTGSEITGIELGSVDPDLTEFSFPDGITSIATGAFQSSAVTSLTIPDSVVSIGARTFVTSSIEEIHFPSGLNSLGAESFKECWNLREVTLPGNLAVIPPWMFEGCSNLKSIIIPEGVVEIGGSAFERCALSNIVIPETTVTISKQAFYRTQIEEMTLPESITRIGANAFSSQLRRINLPESLVKIDDAALANCSNLTSVEAVEGSYAYRWAMEKNLPVVAVESKPGQAYESTESELFSYRQKDDGSLEINGLLSAETCPFTLVLPAEIDGSLVTSIAEGSFKNNKRIRRLVIPEGVTEIGSMAFYNCSYLAEVSLPDTLAIIPDRMFDNCSRLTRIDIPEGVTSIGDFAFNYCQNMLAATLPDTLTSIGSSAFESCNSLSELQIPSGVTEIGGSAFQSCGSLTAIDLPEGLTEINEFTFVYCTGLTEITISQNVETIGAMAFSGCSELVRIYLPDSITSINENAFTNCSKLATVVASEGSFAKSWAESHGYTVVLS